MSVAVNRLNFFHKDIRDILLLKVKRNVINYGYIGVEVQVINTFFQNLYLRNIALHLANSDALEIYDLDLGAILLEDIRNIGCHYAAAVAWLTIDEDWSIYDQFPEAKDERVRMRQGLVLKYPQPVMRAACLLSGITVEEELECINETKKRALKSLTLERVVEKFPRQCKQSVISNINNYHD